MVYWWGRRTELLRQFMLYPEVFLQGSYLSEDLLFWERAKHSSRMIWSVLTRCGEPEASWLDRNTDSQDKPSQGRTLGHLGLRFTNPTSMERQSEVFLARRTGKKAGGQVCMSIVIDADRLTICQSPAKIIRWFNNQDKIWQERACLYRHRNTHVRKRT